MSEKPKKELNDYLAKLGLSPQLVNEFWAKITNYINEQETDLLRELAVRTQVVFPQTPEELKWFEEGTQEAYDFHKRLDSFFNKQRRKINK